MIGSTSSILAANSNSAHTNIYIGICNARRNKARNIVRFYNIQEDRIIRNFTRRVSLFESREALFAASGKDTTELKDDIEMLRDLIDDLKGDIDNLQQIASDLQSLVCDDSNWSGKVSEMFAAEKQIHQDKIKINSFIRTEINPDIIKLRKIPVPTPTV